MKKHHIRTLALCVFQNEGRILVSEGYDDIKDQHYYRPLGGGVEFGETTEEALRREIREELGAEIAAPVLLHVFENIFTYLGEPGHEIIFMYDAVFSDPTLVQKPTLPGVEGKDNEIHFNAIWKPLLELKVRSMPLYPDGLLDLLLRRNQT